MKNIKITYTLYSLINKRKFSSSPILKVEDDLLARIEAKRLMLESQMNMVKNPETNEVATVWKDLAHKLRGLGKKSKEERESMIIYLTHFKNFAAKEDKVDMVEVDKLFAKSDKTKELFNERITEESKSEGSSILKLIKLMKTRDKLVHDAEDKAEFLINKSIEKSFSKGECDIDFQTKYLAARAIRLKERKEFKEEENGIFSESISFLSPVDHVVGIMEGEIPSYTDPED